jgi:hypothetical protein
VRLKTAIDNDTSGKTNLHANHTLSDLSLSTSPACGQLLLKERRKGKQIFGRREAVLRELV